MSRREVALEAATTGQAWRRPLRSHMVGNRYQKLARGDLRDCEAMLQVFCDSFV